MDFKFPEVFVGQTVLWYPGGSRSVKPTMALITKTDQRSVCLAILPPNTYNFLVRDGVRHIDDPDAREADRTENGCFELTVRDRMIAHILREGGYDINAKPGEPKPGDKTKK